MPFDLSVSPSTLLAMWAGGLALATSLVARWRVVGAGFLWTAGGSTLLAGIAAAFAGLWAALGVVAVAAAMATARHPALASWLFAIGGAGFIVHSFGAASDNPLLVVTGAMALGGTTSEMLLGHWYLVDPKLPRWALRRLDGAGIAGLVLDSGYVVVVGGMGAGEGPLRWAFLGLAGMGILMMVGVWFSLKEKGYEGVMAATGLSYLAVLTTLGSVAMGRFLLG